jgi:hypothetical protein
MWSKISTTIALWTAGLLLLVLTACDGASISDYGLATAGVGFETETARSPTMIGSYPHRDLDEGTFAGDGIQYPTTSRHIRIDIFIDTEALHTINETADKLLRLAGPLLLILLGIYLFSRMTAKTNDIQK